MTDVVLLLITASSESEAARIAQALVNERLVACVNIVQGLRSFFVWEGKLQDEGEVLLICKSASERVSDVISRVKALHSYTVPEIITLPVAGGSQDYLQWVRESVK